MRELFVTRAAEADVLEIWTYLFEKSERAADRAVDEIAAQYDLLLQFPLLGRRRPEFGSDYRSLADGRYVIFYRVTETRLEISRVLHGVRDLTGLFASEVDEAEEDL